ncbi:MAG: DUF4174 domain-containing protein [Mucilaginibacter sp.]|uniref:DUF4174 domain-containing protein n=1 Tax=Mucilaginibacter sp. TaxID=1882438 RepID=UPI0032674A9D
MFAICMVFANQKQANRSVLIFADKANNVNVIQQINILKADAKGIHDRDIIYRVITYSTGNVQQYKKWGVTNVPFTVILIGKDNGEKLRSHEPVSLTRLFDLIDNMPMRQQEIKYKH